MLRMIRSGQAVGRIKGGAGGTEVKHFILARTAARLKEEPVTVLAWFLQRSNTFFFPRGDSDCSEVKAADK